jgi:aldehyde:ferredoxin oxidoreductase
MLSPVIYGYTAKILRVDLSSGKNSSDTLDDAVLRKYVGGATLGIKYLYDEVPPGIAWSAPENRLFLGSGPLGGTRVGGSGAVAVVTKGPMTNGIASSQANGFFGAYLRFAGFDGIIVQGAAPKWVYLYIHDGEVELRDAGHLTNKSTLEVEQAIKQELGKKDREVSTLCIGPAGENLVKFALICVDGGHMASHNGVGAVMGSKKLKAVVIARSKNSILFKDEEGLSQAAKGILANTLSTKSGSSTFQDGTVGLVIMGTVTGTVPVKNYTTGVHPISRDKLDTYSSANIRGKFIARPNPCWACTAKHCHNMEITEGKYAGRKLEEPEFEGMAAFSALVGINDVTTTVVLNSEVDRLGLDVNETGWVIAWLMECYEKGILTRKDTDGLEMTWGNGEAIMEMLNRIAYRKGFGDILAEGVMRASRQVGGQAPDFAIHTMKGNTPRSHDHRVMWLELFDTCVSNTGTLETQQGAPFKLLGLPESFDKFDPEAVSTVEAKIKGAMLFEDSLVTCRFNTTTALGLLSQAVNAATGWSFGVAETMTVGKRAANLARAFNIRHGIVGAALDAPSSRYGSTLQDGVAQGKGILPSWEKMLHNYYSLMGWDDKEGRPLPSTLSNLGLDFVIPQIWQ